MKQLITVGLSLSVLSFAALANAPVYTFKGQNCSPENTNVNLYIYPAVGRTDITGYSGYFGSKNERVNFNVPNQNIPGDAWHYLSWTRANADCMRQYHAPLYTAITSISTNINHFTLPVKDCVLKVKASDVYSSGGNYYLFVKWDPGLHTYYCSRVW